MSLAIRGVGHHFPGGSWLFKDLDFDFPQGSLTALSGPSGSGKSTLLRVLSGHIEPISGRVQRDASVAFVHQTSYGSALRTVLDHVVLPFVARGLTREEGSAAGWELLQVFQMETLAHSRFRDLSGGEAQRLMLAIAVAQRRGVILVDEPTASLDAFNAATVVDVLQGLSSRGATVVVATHDARVQAACTSRLDLGAAHREGGMG